MKTKTSKTKTVEKIMLTG